MASLWLIGIASFIQVSLCFAATLPQTASGGPSSSSGPMLPQQQQQTAANCTLPSKKGAGVWHTPALQSVMEDMNVSWIYTWKVASADAGIVTPPGVEEVPLFWQVSDVSTENLAKAAALPSKYVMTFNEPDRLDQGSAKVSEALAVWPRLESLGKFLGAPATASKGLEWFDEFMTQTRLLGYRVDFITLHYYTEDIRLWEPDLAVADMKAYLERVHDKYKLPIWLKEFGLCLWFDSKVARQPSAEVQAEYLKKACAMLDSLDFVTRYAYFPTFPYIENDAMHMYEEDGRITPVGEVYKAAC